MVSLANDEAPAHRHVMFSPSITQLLVVLALALLLFGSTRLPALARAFGQSISEFKKGVKEVEDHSDESEK